MKPVISRLVGILRSENYMNKAYSDYLKWLEDGKKHPYSENTLRSLKTALNQFFEVFKGDINSFTKDDLSNYKEYLLSHPNKGGSGTYTIATVNQRLNHLKKFFQALRYELNYPVDIYIEGEKVQIQNIPEKMLENEDVKELMKDTPNFERQIILGLYYTGARISELLQVKTEDIAETTIRIKGKGGKYRFLFIPDVLMKEWKKYRRSEKVTSELFFCLPDKGEIISRQNTYNRLLRLSNGAGIVKGKMHPHAFRHLYARNLSEAGVQTAIIKQLLGHSLDVTEGYLSISRERLIKIVNSFERLI
jgi:integrase/recombinase XerD